MVRLSAPRTGLVSLKIEYLSVRPETVEDATEIRSRIFVAFENAERETDVVKRNAL
jgi:NADH dehydrogenase FAD-containing subunit